MVFVCEYRDALQQRSRKPDTFSRMLGTRESASSQIAAPWLPRRASSSALLPTGISSNSPPTQHGCTAPAVLCSEFSVLARSPCSHLTWSYRFAIAGPFSPRDAIHAGAPDCRGCRCCPGSSVDPSDSEACSSAANAVSL